MRKIVLMAPALVLAGCNVAGGQDRGDSGQFEKRNVAVAGAFDRVSLAGSQNVIVTVGGAPSVRVEGGAKQLDRLQIENEGGELRIGMKKGSWSWGFSRDTKPVTVYVTMPAISGAEVAGSGDMRIDKAEGGSFSGQIAGSGGLQIAAMKVGEAKFEIAGSGGVKAAGAAERTSYEIMGSGDVDGAGLRSRAAKVEIAGSGNVSAHASETADVTVMGSGDVQVTGGAKCNIEKHGSGEVNCG